VCNPSERGLPPLVLTRRFNALIGPENVVDKNKYLVGLIGLAIGFAISFFLTTNYNKKNASMAVGQPSPGMAGGAAAPGASNQQAMMGNVAATIERAKNNPKDFAAQIDAAKVFNQIGRIAETVEYLQKAYAINPTEFSQLGASGFLGQYYSDQKKYPEAETWFARAIEAEPNEADLYVALAETFIQRQPPQPDRAIDELQRALKVDAKSGHALDHLVEANVLKKDARAAEDALNRLKATDPSNQRIASLETLVADLKAGKAVVLPKE
jgi:tetratricopeptide (TPR) repeat protein